MMGKIANDHMDEWPAWLRWGTWVFAWALYAAAFWLWLSAHGPVAHVIALVGVCAGLLLLMYASKAVLNERVRKVDRWQTRVMLPAVVVYMVLMLYVFPHVDDVLDPWLKLTLALSPLVPLLFVAWAMVRYVNDCDELERRQHLEAAGIAVLVVGLASMTLGFLAAGDLIAVNGTMVLLLVLPALCLMYGIACAWSKWRNRAR